MAAKPWEEDVSLGAGTWLQEKGGMEASATAGEESGARGAAILGRKAAGVEKTHGAWRVAMARDVMSKDTAIHGDAVGSRCGVGKAQNGAKAQCATEDLVWRKAGVARKAAGEARMAATVPKRCGFAKEAKVTTGEAKDQKITSDGVAKGEMMREDPRLAVQATTFDQEAQVDAGASKIEKTEAGIKILATSMINEIGEIMDLAEVIQVVG